jgi:NADH dehydrogenase
MMPGIKRKWRLLVDWNVELLFGRDASELGGLGHPPALGDDTSGGASAEAATEALDGSLRAPAAPS